MTVRWIEPQQTVTGVRWLGDLEQAARYGMGMLGATPTLVKKWFPERTEAEWNNLDPADQDTLLKQAQTVEAKYNATINQYKAEGACDATKPGRLAGALRQMLMNKGAPAAALGPADDEFGLAECAAWYSLMGSSPTIEDAKQAIYATNLSFNSGTATYGWMHLTLSNFCGSSVKLPSCGAPTGPQPKQCDAGYELDSSGNCVPVGPTGCGSDTDCPPGQKCVDGTCQDGGGGVSKAGAAGGGILGVVLLVGATLGALYFAFQAPAGAAAKR